MSEPLDLGATDLDDERARREHGLDRPAEFDQRTGVDDRAETQATLLPEEQAAGSADPQAQARKVLRDSEVRTEVPDAADGVQGGCVAAGAGIGRRGGARLGRYPDRRLAPG